LPLFRTGLKIVASGIVAALLLSFAACAPGESIMNLPPSELPDKGNPKLDSQLNQLVRAESRGETASFAEQSDIELVNGSVRVIIECAPGQLEAASEAATDAGAKLETTHDNMLQAIVPITCLITLADADSIHFIRLPQHPLPAATGGD